MKLLRKVVGVLTALSMLGSMTAVLAVESNTGYIYQNEFNTQEKVNELTRVGSGKLIGTPEMKFSSEKGTMDFTAWGQNTGFLFPESVTASNFVAEGDFVYEKTSNYANGSIGFGFIFGYQSDVDFSVVSYYPLNGEARLYNAANSEFKSRNAEKGRGASFTLAENETAHLKLVVNNGQLEFFVNDELCYSYYSDGTTGGSLTPSRNFKTAGRLGFFSNADKTMITLKNLTVRNIKNSDNVYYTNTFMSSPKEEGTKLKSLNALNTYFKDDNSINDGQWGEMDSYGFNFDSVGRCVDAELTGNYSADMSFAFSQPQAKYSHISFMLGYDKSTNKYIVADVNLGGGISIEQKEIVTTGSTVKEQKISDSSAAYNSYANTIPDNKKDKTEKTTETDDGIILSYMPKDYSSNDAADKIARRHNLHLEVIDGEVSATFEGQTVKCRPDVATTDGYFGYILAGTNAKIYSLRVGKLPEKTTITADYTDISNTSTSADVIISDSENNLTSDAKVILGVYNGNRFIGVNIKAATERNAETGKIDLEASYTTQTNTADITAKVFLWDMKTLTPITDSLILGQQD